MDWKFRTLQLLAGGPQSPLTSNPHPNAFSMRDRWSMTPRIMVGLFDRVQGSNRRDNFPPLYVIPTTCKYTPL